jgi:hypothetical protein
MTKRIDLGRLAGLLMICLSACNVAVAQTDDPCRLVVNLSTDRPKSPNPPFLESALLNDARSGKDYLAAEADWMNAQNQLSAAENKVFATEAGTRRLEAEIRHRTTVAAFLGTPAGQETYSQLLAVCGEIQKLRIQLLTSDGGVTPGDVPVAVEI